MTLLQHNILAFGLTAVTTFGLGLFVFLAEPRKQLNRIFGLYSLAISWWGFTEAFLLGAPSQLAANFWSYIEWPGVILIAPTFIHTVFLSIGERGRKSRAILTVAYVASLVFLMLHLFTDLLTKPPRSNVAFVHFHNDITTVGWLIPLTFLILVNIALFKLWHAYRAATGQRRIQLKYLFWGSLIGYLGGSPDWFFVFGFHVPFLNPFGIYGVPCYSIATTYAVLHHRLFEVNLVIRKSLVYSVLVTALTVGYFGFLFLIERLSQVTFGYQSLWLSLGAFALMALVFQPLKLGIQRLVDRLFFRAPREELVKRVERYEQESRQTEKLKAVATLAAGLCHELRNPMQVMQTHAEYLSDRSDEPKFIEQCSGIMRVEIARISGLLKELMDFAKPKAPDFQWLEPNKVVDSTLELLNNEFVSRQVNLEKRYEANGVKIKGDQDQLRQVILNLVLNAVQAIGQGGRVVVTTGQENGWFTLEVSDSGPGIDPAILPKLFEPFTSGKPGGTGLGLSIVHSIVREHRGEIVVQTKPKHGTVFTVKLPL
ncbi:MAG: hypothetical protein HYS41_03905 [Candidatus Omnitrophica bacterium]|nr:hypothetical protein [Candidatus Omnitrophota bacterium]